MKHFFEFYLKIIKEHIIQIDNYNYVNNSYYFTTSMVIFVLVNDYNVINNAIKLISSLILLEINFKLNVETQIIQILNRRGKKFLDLKLR
jgi:hypothetical protein